MKDPFLIIGYMLLGLMISFEINAQPSIYEIKQHVQNQPFDFEQISQDAEAYKTLLFRERQRRLQFVEIDKYPTPQERQKSYQKNTRSQKNTREWDQAKPAGPVGICAIGVQGSAYK